MTFTPYWPWTQEQDHILLRVVIATNAHLETPRSKRTKSYMTNLSLHKMPVIQSTYNNEAAKINSEPRTVASLKKRFGLLLQKYLRPNAPPPGCVITDEMKPFMQQIVEDRQIAWELQPLGPGMSLSAGGSEKIVGQAQNPAIGCLESTRVERVESEMLKSYQRNETSPCRYMSTCAEEIHGNPQAYRKEAAPGNLRPREPERANANINSQRFPRDGEPERTANKAIPFRKGMLGNNHMSGSAVCTPHNKKETCSRPGAAACGVPEMEKRLNSYRLKDSHVASGNVHPNQDIPSQGFNRGIRATGNVVSPETGTKCGVLPERALSGQTSFDTFDDEIQEHMHVERPQWDSRKVRALKRKARGPPSENDESAAPARGGIDASKRPRTENLVETLKNSKDASLKKSSALQNTGNPLKRIAKESEEDLVRTYNEVEELIFQLNADHQLKILELKQQYEQEEHQLDQELELLQRKLRTRQFESRLEIRRRKQMYEIEELEYYKRLGRIGASTES